MKDKFDREINYARISVTDLCNMRCRYCMPDGVEKKSHEDILTLEQLCVVSDALAELGVSKQRITGGEPLVRRGLISLLGHIGANELVKNLAITTNGQQLADMAADLYKAGVRALNISIDTLNGARFTDLTKCGKLSKTLDGIQAAKEAGFTGIKLNAVLLRGVNDGEIYKLAAFARRENLSIRFIELMPFSVQEKFAKQYFISTDDIVKRYNLQKIEEKKDNVKVREYAFSDGTEVGFISPVTGKFCAECNRVRITADGKLMNCLHESKEYDLKPYLDDKEELKKYITECVYKKPQEHHIADGVLQKRVMEDIGG